jgi:hypothetical protein
MSEAASRSDIDRYEHACDQAIAMCDGNLRSTIKALIMVNEYLEFELHEAHGAASSDQAELHGANDGAAGRTKLR